MKRHLALIAASTFGVVMLVFGIFFQAPVSAAGLRQWCLVLSNAALVPGVLLAGLGGFVKISGEGFFDGLKYAVTSTVARLRGAKPKYSSYYEYSRRDKSKSSAGFLLIPGAVFLGLAVLLTVLYYVMP